MFGAFRCGGGGAFEFFAPHGAGAFHFAPPVLFEFGDDFGDQGIVDAALAQRMSNLDGAVAGAMVGDVAFGEAAVGKPAAGLEFVEQRGDVIGRSARAFELGRKFGTAVFASRKMRQRAVTQRYFRRVFQLFPLCPP